MSVKTPDWERFDFFFDPRYFLRFSDETDVFGCMTRSCSWVRHVTTLGFPRGVWRSEREKKAWGSLSEPMFWANGGASFQKATPDSMNITSFHHWCGCDVEILLDQWHFFKQTLCAFWHFFLVKCVKILLGRFVWFIWMNLNIKSLSWTVDNFISPALDRSSEWRNAYWQFTILIPPLGMLRKKERSATKYLWTEMSPPQKKTEWFLSKKGWWPSSHHFFWWATAIWLTFQDIKTTKYFGSFVTPHDIMTSWGEQPEFVLGWDFFFKKLMVQTQLPLHQMFDSIFSPHFCNQETFKLT